MQFFIVPQRDVEDLRFVAFALVEESQKRKYTLDVYNLLGVRQDHNFAGKRPKFVQPMAVVSQIHGKETR